MTLSNIQTQVSEVQLAAMAQADLASELGIELITFGETPVPVWPFIALGFAIYDILQLVGAGRPKFADTDNVITAYQMSAYAPLHSLAADLAIAAKNGAPISDSRPAVQAQFSAWKQGTYETIQTLAGGQPGATQPGYWQLEELVNLSWALSGQGEQEVLKVVKAIDQFTQGLTQYIAQQKAQSTTTTTTTTTPPPPPPQPGNCEGPDPESDEILDACRATQAALAGLVAGVGQGGTIDPCCERIIVSIAHVVSELSVIAQALAFSEPANLHHHLGAIAPELANLVAAITAYQPAVDMIKSCLCDGLAQISTAIASAPGTNLQPVVDALNNILMSADVPQAIIDQLATVGALTPEFAQLASGAWWPKVLFGWFGTLWQFISGGLNPDLGTQVAANIKALQNHQAVTFQPIHSLMDVPFYLLCLVGTYWTEWAVDLAGAGLPAAQIVLNNIGAAVTAAIPGGLGTVPPGIGAPAIAALRFVQGAPAPGEIITPDNYQPIVEDAMGRAGLLGMTAWAAAMVGGMLLGPWEKYWGEVAAMLATAAGFEEISKQMMAPFLHQVIGLPAQYDAARNWRTRLPDLAHVDELLGRRVIDQATWSKLIAYTGLTPDFEAAYSHLAYRPISPFILASAFVDAPFPTAQLQDVLNDNSYSPAHVQFMIDTFKYKSTANVRNGYVTAAVGAHSKGVLSDQELSDILNQVGWSTEAQLFAQQHSLIMRREAVAAEVSAQVIALVESGNMTSDQGLQQLETAGVQPWQANLKITLATTRATIRMAKLEATAERRAELARAHNLTRIAISEYQQGALDDAGLLAALLLIPP